jgi:hypothetical protein
MPTMSADDLPSLGIRWAVPASVDPALRTAAADSSSVEVVVQGAPGASSKVAAAVEAAGGELGEPLPIIDGFAATIPAAGVYTGLIFTGLTATVFFTKKDFSFLGPILAVAGMVALGVIVCSALFGFSLGNLCAGVMVAFAAGYILFNTSQVLHQYPTNAHVAASLQLFASVALLFWYILRILSSSRR